MRRLSTPLEAMLPRYDVVVVGSGYGGAIAASRLARAGRSVAVLERGPERHPGEFPETTLEAQAEMQAHTNAVDFGKRTGLFDFQVDDEVCVLRGCGLGGTSLINANVSLRADPRVFDDPVWPAALRADAAALDEATTRAERMLGANPYPDDWPRLAKYEALKRSAAHMGLPVRRPAINVTFKDGPNAAGVDQKACVLCGDCVTGCNHGAKNTTLMNYLPDAVNHGAQIFVCASVTHLERNAAGGWLVYYEPLGVGREAFRAGDLFVVGDIVVLAGGALGTTEILLRSREAGVPMSSRVGRRFSGNGDVIGFAYNADQEVHGVGTGAHLPESGREVGPCISGVIDGRATPNLEDGFIIEEGSVPGPVGVLTPAMYAAAGPMIGDATEHTHASRNAWRTIESLFMGARHGAADRAQTFLLMSHDDSGGEVALEGGRLRLRWPRVGDQPHFAAMDKQLREASAGVAAVYYRDPIWTSLLGDRLITVHPLGGAPMSERAETGATNHKGQVFRGTTGEDVWDDLYVMCGAAIPRSVGVNPLITISALAERNCALLAADRGWTIDYSAKPFAEAAEAHAPALEFTETMRGFWSPGDADFVDAESAGKREGRGLAFTLTIRAPDALGFFEDPAHAGTIFGTVDAPALSPEPLSVSGGTFNLFVDDADHVNERRMQYRMVLRSSGGNQWYFDGFKRVRGGNPLHAWPETSTLYITIHQGGDASGEIVGRGVLHIRPSDFQKQLTTLKVTGAAGAAERLSIIYQFGRLFAGTLYEAYGGVFGRTTPFQPSSVPRKRRALRVGAPDLHPIIAADGTSLMLTRYCGGNRGPLVLAPGFGTPAAAFALDTVETTPLEFFFEAGYDVWLFDYRASPALASAAEPFTIDDIATKDWPAAIEAVRAATGSADVQVVAHCVGSLSFLMAQLSGLTGVRSAVCSSLSLHPRAPSLTEVKAGLRLPSVLHSLGIDRLTADTPSHSWHDKALDQLMRLYPTKERCHSPVCRKILFMYGEVYDHDQLNTATHDALHEVFGVAHMKPFAHLAGMVRAGHAVDANGADVYMPHVERLGIPITFVHGESNNMFLPEGSRLTLDWLRQHHGDELHQRILIPGYAHMDVFIGKEASSDVFPTLVAELERQSELRPAGRGAR
jgi:cholesterol oxidase